jgi:transposase
MSKALSLDLRERVLAAIAGGMSGRQAALRFGVSAASASRWRTLERKQGDAKPGPLGGDRRSKRIEAHAEVILAETRDMTLEDLRAALADQGLEFGYGTLWRFFDRHGITLKKDSACERARAPRCRKAPPGVVRPAAGSRSRPAGVHRRDLGQH